MFKNYNMLYVPNYKWVLTIILIIIECILPRIFQYIINRVSHQSFYLSKHYYMAIFPVVCNYVFYIMNIKYYLVEVVELGRHYC